MNYTLCLLDSVENGRGMTGAVVAVCVKSNIDCRQIAGVVYSTFRTSAPWTNGSI